MREAVDRNLGMDLVYQRMEFCPQQKATRVLMWAWRDLLLFERVTVDFRGQDTGA